jgi:two-component system chemotaxis response regulator CheB
VSDPIVEPDDHPPPRLVAIGGSAGAMEPLRAIVAGLPPDLDACVLVVIHVPRTTESALPRVLGRRTALPVAHAVDGHVLQGGTVLVAPPDHHLTVADGVAQVRRGPEVNRSRPAIDPLFRSVALHRSPAVGIVLSGALDDGAGGLAEIARAGGTAIVQAPDEAVYPSMPLAALDRVPDAVLLPAVDIGPSVVHLLDRAEPGRPPAADQLVKELTMTRNDPNAPGADDLGASSSVFGCPDCGGTLWELGEGGDFRFRCRIGHAFSPRTLLDAQRGSVEEGLWIAIRALEEQSTLAHRLAVGARERGQREAHDRFVRQAGETERQADAIRRLLRDEQDLTEADASHDSAQRERLAG